MAIRDKFRRAVSPRKSMTSTSSSSSSSHGTETSTLASTEPEVPSPTSPANRKSRARTFTWRPSKTAEEKEQQKKSKKKQRAGSPDPREKPFTEMNLRYQEILGSFELTFGTSHPEQLWNPDGGLSPGTSRQNSFDFGRN